MPKTNDGPGSTMTKIKPAVIGLRAKTGKAIAMVLGGPEHAPQAICRSELTLSAPGSPATYQPYHEVMELPWDQAQVAVRVSAAVVERLASEALAGLAEEVRSKGFTILRVAVVGAPARRLESIGSPHVRAHAAEGVFFRQALEVAAAANSLKSSAFVEKGLLTGAEAQLGFSESVFNSNVARLGVEFGRPWRADEKMAAVAAWIALVARAR